MLPTESCFCATNSCNDHNPPTTGDGNDYTNDVPLDEKNIKCSTTASESGWFRKGEHKHGFAYAIEIASDKNGWILGYTVNSDIEHESRTFKGLCDIIKNIGIETLVMDSCGKTFSEKYSFLASYQRDTTFNATLQ